MPEPRSKAGNDEDVKPGRVSPTAASAVLARRQRLQHHNQPVDLMLLDESLNHADVAEERYFDRMIDLVPNKADDMTPYESRWEISTANSTASSVVPTMIAGSAMHPHAIVDEGALDRNTHLPSLRASAQEAVGPTLLPRHPKGQRRCR